MNDIDLQRRVTRFALAALEGTEFALAGSGAIREHGVTERPTEDIDLFTANTSTAEFATAVNRVEELLRAAGYTVTLDPDRRTAQFVRLQIDVPGSGRVDIDMAMDWRQSEPVTLAVGPVLSLEDAVHSKVSALYGRAAARDFLDVDAIRASGRFTDAELLAAAAARDDGFKLAQFATQLDLAQRLRLDMVAEYGIDLHQLGAIKMRFASWARELRYRSPRTDT